MKKQPACFVLRLCIHVCVIPIYTHSHIYIYSYRHIYGRLFVHELLTCKIFLDRKHLCLLQMCQTFADYFTFMLPLTEDSVFFIYVMHNVLHYKVIPHSLNAEKSICQPLILPGIMVPKPHIHFVPYVLCQTMLCTLVPFAEVPFTNKRHTHQGSYTSYFKTHTDLNNLLPLATE